MEIFTDIENLFMKCQFFNLIWAAQAQEQGELKKEDIDYILNIAKTEGDICRRMTTARKRQESVA